MEEKLRFIDEKYLSAFDADVDSAIKEQAAFSQVKELQIEYPVSESEEEEDNTYLSYNMVGNADVTWRGFLMCWIMRFSAHPEHH